MVTKGGAPKSPKTEKPKGTSGRRCSICRQTGHTKRNCPTLDPKKQEIPKGAVAEPVLMDIEGVSTLLIPERLDKVIKVTAQTESSKNQKSFSITLNLDTLEILVDKKSIGKITNVVEGPRSGSQKLSYPVGDKSLSSSLGTVQNVSKWTKWMITCIIRILEFVWYDAQLLGPVFGISIYFGLSVLSPSIARRLGLAVVNGIPDFILALQADSAHSIFMKAYSVGKTFLEFYSS